MIIVWLKIAVFVKTKKYPHNLERIWQPEIFINLSFITHYS